MAKRGAAFYNKLTREYMSDIGFSCSLVERYEHHSQKRHDLLGFIDFVSIGKQDDNFNIIVGVQSTSGSHHQDHKRKMLESERFPLWARSENRKILLLTFSKKIKPGSKKQKTWQPRAEWLTMKDWTEYQKTIKKDNKPTRESLRRITGETLLDVEHELFGDE